MANIETPITNPVKYGHTTEERLTDVSAMESTHVSTLTLTGLYKEASNIDIFPATNTAPLISLGVLCGDGCTITLDKKPKKVQNNGQ